MAIVRVAHHELYTWPTAVLVHHSVGVWFLSVGVSLHYVRLTEQLASTSDNEDLEITAETPGATFQQ